MTVVHASAVLLGQKAVLLTGESGNGKSTIALQLIKAHEATLIGDDRVYLAKHGAVLMARPHDNLLGLLEMRGLGLLRLPYCQKAAVALAVELTSKAHVPRLATNAIYQYDGLSIPLLRLDGHDPNTPLKITLALTALAGGFREDAVYPLEDQ